MRILKLKFHKIPREKDKKKSIVTITKYDIENTECRT